jgi:hypothetical protein
MLADSNEKLVVYASDSALSAKRLRPVSLAVERMAKLLGANVEVVTFKKKLMPIYVYYKRGKDDPIPLYCDNGEQRNLESICSALGNIMFVLSFHPKHSALARIRQEFTRFS